jgi:hypothetical protein
MNNLRSVHFQQCQQIRQKLIDKIIFGFEFFNFIEIDAKHLRDVINTGSVDSSKAFCADNRYRSLFHQMYEHFLCCCKIASKSKKTTFSIAQYAFFMGAFLLFVVYIFQKQPNHCDFKNYWAFWDSVKALFFNLINLDL